MAHQNDSEAHMALNLAFPHQLVGRVHFLRHCQYKYVALTR